MSGQAGSSLEPGWVDLGLHGYNVVHIELDWPYLYAAAESAGLLRLKADDPGAEWTVIGFDTTKVISEYRGVYDVVVLDNGDILAGLDRGMPHSTGLYRSSDGGESWEPSDTGMADEEIEYSSVVRSLAAGPDGSGLVFAAGYGLYRSEDRGNTWSLVWGDPKGYGSSFHEVVCNPSASAVLWAGGHTPMWFPVLLGSADGGQTWALQWEAIKLTGSNDVVSLAVDPADAGVAYVGRQYCGMIRTEDGGATWVQAAGPDASTLPHEKAHMGAIEPDESKPGHLFFAGGDVLYESWDGARTAEVLECPTPEVIADLAYDESHKALYLATRGRVIRYIPE
jgi:photosystem II stability/assembly factor-like uncharacterized protein